MYKFNLKKIKTVAMETWKFASFIEIDKEFKVNGLNIWNFYWTCTDKNVEVRHPEERTLYQFKEYEISDGNKSVSFVAGEFSSGKVGIFTKDEIMERKLL